MIASLLTTLLMTSPTLSYQTSSPSTLWLGAPVYAVPYTGIDPSFYMGQTPPTTLTDMDIEIGLRDDGIMAWRKKEKERTSGISQFNGLAGPPVKFKMEEGCK